MSVAGKYVRSRPVVSDSESEGAECDEVSTGRYVRAPCILQDDQVDEFIHYEPSTEPDIQKQLESRILELENIIAEIRHTRGESTVENLVTNSSIPMASSSTTGDCTVRWDNIKPFPKNIPASKMWEAWTCFIEDFEMAASLSNTHNPKRRVELLLLSMGDELRSIVRAARLRPSSSDDKCYETFIKNVDEYLKSMTDPAAEHEAFTNMKQEEGESAINFHARLSEKVRLCGYSLSDQERFVRTQLIRGLRNQELKKAARTYGHDSNLIVQSATRAEAFQAEICPTITERSPLETGSTRYQVARVQQTWKSKNNRDFSYRTGVNPSSRQLNVERSQLSRRHRCPRCSRPSHRGEECPAMRKNCNSCGQRGHFAAVCRNKRIDIIEDIVQTPHQPVGVVHKQQVKDSYSD